MEAFPQTRRTRPAGAAELLLVRHGETTPYVPGQPFDAIADGTGDPPLAPEGIEGAEQVGRRLASEDIAAVYVTPLRRTLQTAAPLLAKTGHQPIEIADLQEVHLGEWERGISRQHFAEGHPAALAAKEQRRWELVPGAENTDAFAARVRRGIEFIAERHPNQLAVAFLHGGVIGEVLHQATSAPRFTFSIDNASISHLFVAPGDPPEKWVVRAVNDTAHRPYPFGS